MRAKGSLLLAHVGDIPNVVGTVAVVHGHCLLFERVRGLGAVQGDGGECGFASKRKIVDPEFLHLGRHVVVRRVPHAAVKLAEPLGGVKVGTHLQHVRGAQVLEHDVAFAIVGAFSLGIKEVMLGVGIHGANAWLVLAAGSAGRVGVLPHVVGERRRTSWVMWARVDEKERTVVRVGGWVVGRMGAACARRGKTWETRVPPVLAYRQ